MTTAAAIAAAVPLICVAVTLGVGQVIGRAERRDRRRRLARTL